MTDTFSTPADFLKAIGRSSETKLTVEKWEDFWKTSGYDLKKSGLAVRDRRCDVLGSLDLAHTIAHLYWQIHPLVHGEIPQWAPS